MPVVLFGGRQSSPVHRRRPASTPQRNHPIIPYKVTIVMGQMNALSFIPYLRLQKSTGMVDISNIIVERVVTDPELPGFHMRIPPPGAQIIGCDTCAVSESTSFMAVCGDPAPKRISRKASLRATIQTRSVVGSTRLMSVSVRPAVPQVCFEINRNTLRVISP